MFSTPGFLRNVLCFEKVNLCVGLVCKYSSKSDKKPNVIKTFNAENKYLYGKLLESQKQRRKKLIKEEHNSVEKDVSTINTSSENDSICKTSQIGDSLNKCNKTVLNQRTKNLAGVNSADTVLKSSQSPLLIQLDVSSNGDGVKTEASNNSSNQNRSSSDMKTMQTRSVKLKASKGTETEHDKSTSSLNVDNFVFKSVIPINDSNYLLESKEKVLASNATMESVVCFGFSDPAVKSYMKFPSVTKVIEETMSEKQKEILSKWRQNMIKELGEDGFNKYSEALKSRGQEFHTAVRNTVVGKSTDSCSSITQNALRSLSWALELVSSPLAVESLVAHPQLGYKGVLDCVASFRNVPVVIDWKLSDKPKKALKDTYDAPVQITAYMGALNHDPNYRWGVNHGLVVVAYTSGDPCDVFLLAPKHCQIYWRHWLERIDQFKARSHLHLDHTIV